MSITMDPVASNIHRQLQSAFKSVAKLHEKWNDVESNIKGTLKQIEYTAAQLQGVQNADLTKSRVLQKFPGACDVLVSELDSELDSCQVDISDALEEQATIVSELLDLHQSAMERSNAMDELYMGDCGEWPPVPTMLQSLRKIHTICYTIYHQRKFHVDNLDSRDEEKVTRMVQSWKTQKELTDTVEGILCRLEEHQQESF